ncbi:MAG: hypothetical protein H6733_05010 [Alphaproteobacteria bacterium]|nr:hypothetical protein [Alphaproteobacteria bacterium]
MFAPLWFVLLACGGSPPDPILTPVAGPDSDAPAEAPAAAPPDPLERSVLQLERAANAAEDAGPACGAMADALAPIMEETADLRRQGMLPDHDPEEAAAVQARYGPRIAAASQRLARSLADCQADPDILRVMRIATE